MKTKLELRNLLLISCILILSINAFSQQGNLKQGEQITFKSGKFKVMKIEIATITPINKTKVKSGNHFIFINLKLLEIEKNTNFSSVSFILFNKTNKYTQPSAWGKIEIMGSLSNFEATDGATVYVRKPDEVLNLIFEVPLEIWTNQFQLKYDYN